MFHSYFKKKKKKKKWVCTFNIAHAPNFEINASL